MSNFDEIRFWSRHLSAEEKLISLHSESLRWLPTIQAYATLLHRVLEQPTISEKSSELAKWSSQITDAADHLRELIDGLTLPQQHDERGIPELRPYASLLEAVRKIAHKLDLPLADAIDDKSKVFIHSEYPLVLLDEPKYHREVSFTLNEARYGVELLSFVENRSFQVECQVWPASLDDVAKIMSGWLLEKWTASHIQQMYSTSDTGG